MSYSIPSSTKILNLTTTPFLFILVSVLSLNLLWCQECIFSCTPRKKRYTQKDLNPCLSLYILLWQGHCWIGKNTNKEFNCVYGVCNLTKQHFEILICFWFQLLFEQTFPKGITSKQLPPPPVPNEQNQARWNPKQN